MDLAGMMPFAGVLGIEWTEFRPRPNREIRALELFPFERLPEETSSATTRRIGECLAGATSVTDG